ncbi:MAG TPA: phosphomannomutase [Gammaproteobacteria bacterium]|nr:phosphomannomutase [Gammaproteobacteria bacterium]
MNEKTGPLGHPIRCFKAYDVRGRVPDELDENIAYRIARAWVDFIGAKRVCMGRDVRPTSDAFADAVAAGLIDSGVEVRDLGICGTEESYFGTFHQGLDGGVMITASHNPSDYNGLKFVREGAHPISADNGLEDIRALAERGEFRDADAKGKRVPAVDKSAYVAHLLSYVEVEKLKELRLVVNPGNGCAGPIVQQLERSLPFEFVKMDFEPDGSFPNGVPNPMLEENRRETSAAVRAHKADLGIAWDGDFDRCFFYDEHGSFVEGYYIVGLLAEAFLRRNPGARVLHDPRLTWNTVDIVREFGGTPIVSKSGHAFMKEKMRTEDCIYGGEMSAHHYFRKFGYCDSGMIPWLLVAGLISATGTPLSALVADREAKFPASGEINREVADQEAAMAAVKARFAQAAVAVERLDGLSMEFERWRFNLRPSNTEPLLRLNVESRADRGLMELKTKEILELIGG